MTPRRSRLLPLVALLVATCLASCGPAESHPEPRHDDTREAPSVEQRTRVAPHGVADSDALALRAQDEGAENPAVELAHGVPQTGAVPAGTATDVAADPPPADVATDTDAGLATPLDGPPDLTGWHVGPGHRGVHTLAWRPVDRDAVPRNEEFEIEVLILRDGQPQPGMRLAVSGWMPDHEHGLVRSPLIEEVGGGHYLVSGLLLHMRGSWQLRFQVFAGRDTETATFDVEL